MSEVEAIILHAVVLGVVITIGFAIIQYIMIARLMRKHHEEFMQKQQDITVIQQDTGESQDRLNKGLMALSKSIKDTFLNESS